MSDQTELRDRIAEALKPNVFPKGRPGDSVTADHVARWIGEDVMKAVAPALAARDARIAELEKERYGTLARRCSIPGCHAAYDAADGPPPREATQDRHWLRTPSPSVLLCPDHSRLWEGAAPHKPALDHATRTAACSCGHPLPGPTLGHMGNAWIAHALALLDDESGPDAWDFSRMEHETDKLRDHIRALEERLAAVRSVLATWEHRTHHGDSAPMDLLRDLQAAVADRPTAQGTDPAATWPGRAARRLADDAHPATEGNTP